VHDGTTRCVLRGRARRHNRFFQNVQHLRHSRRHVVLHSLHCHLNLKRPLFCVRVPPRVLAAVRGRERCRVPPPPPTSSIRARILRRVNRGCLGRAGHLRIERDHNLLHLRCTHNTHNVRHASSLTRHVMCVTTHTGRVHQLPNTTTVLTRKYGIGRIVNTGTDKVCLVTKPVLALMD
jgi:hypothetical protein